VHLHRAQNVAFSLSQTMHDCTAEVFDIVMRDAGFRGALMWYLSSCKSSRAFGSRNKAVMESSICGIYINLQRGSRFRGDWIIVRGLCFPAL
jgi:hypothetical protein